VDVIVKKYIDENAHASHEHHRNKFNNSNNDNNNDNNSNIENSSNDTIFGSTFSNMKINFGLSEYKEKMKKCII
jgi:hypothetical protein